jgi:ABC-type Fe3+ transport system permease subunit
MIFVYFYRRLTFRTERYVTVTGRGYRPNIIDLGKWRYAASAVAGLILLLIVALPLIVLVYVSFITYVHVPSAKRGVTDLIIIVRTSRIVGVSAPQNSLLLAVGGDAALIASGPPGDH